jgi:hypothetical protein
VEIGDVGGAEVNGGTSAWRVAFGVFVEFSTCGKVSFL